VDNASGTRAMCAELSWNGGATWTAAKSTPSLSTFSVYLHVGERQ